MLNCKECGGKKWYAKIDRKTGLQVKHHRKFDDGTEYDLRVWRCWRCGHAQEEVRPFIPLGIRTGANILYIDLEVSKSLMTNYGLKVPTKYIHHENLIHSYYIICWSASYLGNNKVWSGCVTPEQALRWTDKEILQPLRDLMASADIIAGHNVDAYDLKRANTRFLLNGIEPVLEKKTEDTLKIARTKFSFESNTLDFINKALGLRPKDDISATDWNAIVRTGDEAALHRAMKYNRGDVVGGKAMLERLRKYSGKKVGYGSVSLESEPNWFKKHRAVA